MNCSPQVLFFEEAEVAVVDVKDKVIGVSVKSDDLSLGVGSHALEQDALVVLCGLRSILLLCLPAELHLVVRSNMRHNSSQDQFLRRPSLFYVLFPRNYSV